MNERIRELAFESANGLLSFDETGFQLSENEVEKFAELIIKECVRYFNEDYQRDFDSLWREDLSKGIKQHFGVKE
jgi:hypothetical protein